MDNPEFDGLELNDHTFNMGIATLMRIDNCLKMLSAFQKIRHKTAVLRHLRELHKEVYPFLKEPEKAEGWAMLEDIGRNIQTPLAWDKLDGLDYWLRDQLYKRGLLMHKGMNAQFAVLGGGMR